MKFEVFGLLLNAMLLPVIGISQVKHSELKGKVKIIWDTTLCVNGILHPREQTETYVEKWDPQGNIVERVSNDMKFVALESFPCREEYKYDRFNNEILHIGYRCNNTVLFRRETAYNKESKKVKEDFYENGKLASSKTYRYTNNNRDIVCKEMHVGKAAVLNGTHYMKCDATNNVIWDSTVDSQGKFYQQYSSKYDERGNQIECVFSNMKGDKGPSTIWKYDSNGWDTACITYSKANLSEGNYRKKYENFDEKGNYRKVTSYHNDTVSSIWVRRYEYYE